MLHLYLLCASIQRIQSNPIQCKRELNKPHPYFHISTPKARKSPAVLFVFPSFQSESHLVQTPISNVKRDACLRSMYSKRTTKEGIQHPTRPSTRPPKTPSERNKRERRRIRPRNATLQTATTATNEFPQGKKKQKSALCDATWCLTHKQHQSST